MIVIQKNNDEFCYFYLCFVLLLSGTVSCLLSKVVMDTIISNNNSKRLIQFLFPAQEKEKSQVKEREVLSQVTQTHVHFTWLLQLLLFYLARNSDPERSAR